MTKISRVILRVHIPKITGASIKKAIVVVTLRKNNDACKWSLGLDGGRRVVVTLASGE
jgi:hypothetical protein